VPLGVPSWGPAGSCTLVEIPPGNAQHTVVSLESIEQSTPTTTTKVSCGYVVECFMAVLRSTP